MMTGLKTIILVRHGESKHHVHGLSGGWTDSPLTDFGGLQANATGQALAASGMDETTRLLSSDLRRARETAVAIERHTGLKAEYHRELREMNNGLAAYKTVEEASRLSLPMTQPRVDWVPYPEAESWRVMSVRVTAFLDAVAAAGEGRTVLLVSHGNVLVAAVHWWLGLGEDYWSSISYRFDCSSISELSINQWGERSISRLNDTSHVPERQRPEASRAADRANPAADA